MATDLYELCPDCYGGEIACGECTLLAVVSAGISLEDVGRLKVKTEAMRMVLAALAAKADVNERALISSLNMAEEKIINFVKDGGILE